MCKKYRSYDLLSMAQTALSMAIPACKTPPPDGTAMRMPFHWLRTHINPCAIVHRVTTSQKPHRLQVALV